MPEKNLGWKPEWKADPLNWDTQQAGENTGCKHQARNLGAECEVGAVGRRTSQQIFNRGMGTASYICLVRKGGDKSLEQGPRLLEHRPELTVWDSGSPALGGGRSEGQKSGRKTPWGPQPSSGSVLFYLRRWHLFLLIFLKLIAETGLNPLTEKGLEKVYCFEAEKLQKQASSSLPTAENLRGREFDLLHPRNRLPGPSNTVIVLLVDS